MKERGRKREREKEREREREFHIIFEKRRGRGERLAATGFESLSEPLSKTYHDTSSSTNTITSLNTSFMRSIYFFGGTQRISLSRGREIRDKITEKSGCSRISEMVIICIEISKYVL